MTIDWVAIIIALAFIVLDYVSGIVKGFANQNLSSTVMRQGLWHKVGYILIIALAVACEWASGYIDLGLDIPLVVPVVVYICLTELVSILENISRINPELKNVPVFKPFEKEGKWDDTTEKKS